VVLRSERAGLGSGEGLEVDLEHMVTPADSVATAARKKVMTPYAAPAARRLLPAARRPPLPRRHGPTSHQERPAVAGRGTSLPVAPVS
jgi:hypothetical protein